MRECDCTGMADRFFTIVMPVYKTPKMYMTKAIESCLRQSYDRLELIIVDDGSPDSCGETADAYAKKDSRIRVIHQTNQGASVARNAGIQAAAGDYIVFLDADDWLNEDALAFLNETLKRHGPTDVVIFALFCDYADASIPIRPMYPSPTCFRTQSELDAIRRDVLAKPLDKNILVFPYCKCVRRESLRAIQPCFPVGLAMCEDVVFSLKLLLSVQSVLYFNQPMYHYRQTSQSAVNRYREHAVHEQAMFLNEIERIIESVADRQAYLQGYYLEAFYAMQRLVTQHFFHKDAPGTWIRRHKQCERLFGQAPYADVFKHLCTRDLSRNHKIKAFLLKRKRYALVGWLRVLFFKLPGQRHAE